MVTITSHPKPILYKIIRTERASVGPSQYDILQLPIERKETLGTAHTHPRKRAKKPASNPPSHPHLTIYPSHSQPTLPPRKPQQAPHQHQQNRKQPPQNTPRITSIDRKVRRRRRGRGTTVRRQRRAGILPPWGPTRLAPLREILVRFRRHALARAGDGLRRRGGRDWCLEGVEFRWFGGLGWRVGWLDDGAVLTSDVGCF